MNGDQPRIEIFEPFGTAFERMKRILFQPFDFAKWCVVGFAAFLSGSWGSGFGFRVPGKGDWTFRSSSHGDLAISGWPALWFLPFIIAGAILIFIVVLVLMWIRARGRFIFTDCVVKNRAAIVAPWNEYRREGNSFFLFSLAVMFLALVVMAALVLPIVVPLGLFSHGKLTTEIHPLAVVAFVLVGLLWLAFAVFFAVVTQFMIPIMYRRHCLAREAFFEVLRLVLARPGPIILYVLFGFVLILALLLVSTIVSCLTCCVAGLPYVSSVVLLPAFVWLLAFKLLFLQQFGPDYDVWATAESQAPAAAPTVPPVQPPPPPTSPPSPAE